MPSYTVRFKVLLFKAHRERLDRARIVLESSKPGMQIGAIKTGEPINTVRVEAGSEQEAVTAVQKVLVPDDVNFANWEAESG